MEIWLNISRAAVWTVNWLFEFVSDSWNKLAENSWFIIKYCLPVAWNFIQNIMNTNVTRNLWSKTRAAFPVGLWRHPCATASAWYFVLVCCTYRTDDGLHLRVLFKQRTCRYLFDITAKFRRSFRRWLGFRGFGLLWTSEFAHSEPGPPGSGRTAVYRFLLLQSCLQPVQVSTVAVHHNPLIYTLNISIWNDVFQFENLL